MKKIFLISILFLSLAGVAHAQPVQSSASSWLNLQTGQTQIGGTPQQTGTSPQSRSGNLNYVPLEPLYPYQQADISGNNFGNLFNAIFKLLISIGALVAVVTMVIGGIMYMTSEVTHTKETSKNRMTSAVYGLLLLAGSYLILSTINPNLTRISLQPGQITGQQTQTTGGAGSGSATRPTDQQVRECEQKSVPNAVQYSIAYNPNGTWTCTAYGL